jgi:DHA2 family methylenomycin A resistance protein-like MFS transporter
MPPSSMSPCRPSATPRAPPSLGCNEVVDSYTLVLAGFMLTGSMLTDWGPVGSLSQVVLFTLGSAGCARASFAWLVPARWLQGLGAAAPLPCSLALIVHGYPEPPRQSQGPRGSRPAALFSGAHRPWYPEPPRQSQGPRDLGCDGMLGVAMGPVLGGALITAGGWRAFYSRSGFWSHSWPSSPAAAASRVTWPAWPSQCSDWG